MPTATSRASQATRRPPASASASTRAPVYRLDRRAVNLQRAHDENPIFHQVPTLSLWDGLRAVRFKLWDEQHGRLVTFAHVRRAPAAPAQPTP
jgi:hypothetical protein